MNHDEEIKRLLIAILELGILRIRVFGWDGRAAECADEADHIHNLPSLVLSPNLDRVRYYNNVERPSFVCHATSTCDQFATLWASLDSVLNAIQPSKASKD
jgi:hypothetical protein